MPQTYFDKIKKETARFAPESRMPQGMLNFDISIYPTCFTCEFVLYGDDCGKEMFVETFRLADHYYKDVIPTHRGMTRNWNKIVKKDGKKVCQAGYPIFGEIDELNAYKYLVIRLTDNERWKDEDGEQVYAYIMLQLDIRLTEENPAFSLEVSMVVDQDQTYVMAQSCGPGDKGDVYIGGRPSKHLLKLDHITLEGDRSLGKKFMFAPEYTVLFSPAIQIFAQTPA